jgi:hypothetical protein
MWWISANILNELFLAPAERILSCYWRIKTLRNIRIYLPDYTASHSEDRLISVCFRAYSSLREYSTDFVTYVRMLITTNFKWDLKLYDKIV